MVAANSRIECGWPPSSCPRRWSTHSGSTSSALASRYPKLRTCIRKLLWIRVALSRRTCCSQRRRHRSRSRMPRKRAWMRVAPRRSRIRRHRYSRWWLPRHATWMSAAALSRTAGSMGVGARGGGVGVRGGVGGGGVGVAVRMLASDAGVGARYSGTRRASSSRQSIPRANRWMHVAALAFRALRTFILRFHALAIFIAASAREPPHALSSSYCSASPFSDRNFFSIRSISACGMPSDIMLEISFACAAAGRVSQGPGGSRRAGEGMRGRVGPRRRGGGGVGGSPHHVHVPAAHRAAAGKCPGVPAGVPPARGLALPALGHRAPPPAGGGLPALHAEGAGPPRHPPLTAPGRARARARRGVARRWVRRPGLRQRPQRVLLLPRLHGGGPGCQGWGSPSFVPLCSPALD